MTEFFAMGGHAAYIWPCYALAIAIMGYLLVQSIHAMRTNETMVAAIEQARAEKKRKQAGATDA